MRERNRSERWITDRRKIKLQDRIVAQRARVVNAERHYKVVRMLRVDKRPSEGGFAGLKELRIAPSGYGGWIEAQHHVQQKTALSNVTSGAKHAPTAGI